MKHYILGLLCALVCCVPLFSADGSVNPPPDARFKADLLLVVAHPDDETEIGAYLARAVFDEKKRVAVVFGTRGNGGGNAEGQEQAAALGAEREIEARQALEHFGILHVWFLNGLDTPSQVVLHSLETWNHGDSLGRLVRIVRLTRPSVIVTWLPDWVAGENHGDHQAAGVIATEAFDSAGDPTVFPEQLAAPRDRFGDSNLTEGLHPWQPEKIYYFSDASHTDFLKGKGPAYSAADTSPAKQATYAKLAAEECAYHLTQGDTGQMAKEALAKGDLKFFEEPVLFVFGKSYVKSTVKGGLFEGVQPAGIPYHRASGYIAPPETGPSIELGSSWRFYRQFWQAHDLEHLSKLLTPEIMAKYESPLFIPVIVTNPTGAKLEVGFSVDVPRGWTVKRPLPAKVSIDAQQTTTFQLGVNTASEKTNGWQTIAIDATSNGSKLGQIRIRAQLDNSAMPE